jgi:hypothetical protein
MTAHALIQVDNPMKEVMTGSNEDPMNMDPIYNFVEWGVPKFHCD